MIASLLGWLFEKDNKQMVEDWTKQFPDRCMICSYQAYGYANGITSDSTPPPHECLYAKKNEPVKV